MLRGSSSFPVAHGLGNNTTDGLSSAVRGSTRALYVFARVAWLIGEVPLADNPIADLRLSPDGAQVYVLDRGFTKFKKPWPAGNLYIVNSQSGKLVNSQSVGVFPAFYPDEASASMNICSWATAPVGFMGTEPAACL